MPFVSRRQMGTCFALRPYGWDCEKWLRETPCLASLPARESHSHGHDVYLPSHHEHACGHKTHKRITSEEEGPRGGRFIRIQELDGNKIIFDEKVYVHSKHRDSSASETQRRRRRRHGGGDGEHKDERRDQGHRRLHSHHQVRKAGNTSEPKQPRLLDDIDISISLGRVTNMGANRPPVVETYKPKDPKLPPIVFDAINSIFKRTFGSRNVRSRNIFYHPKTGFVRIHVNHSGLNMDSRPDVEAMLQTTLQKHPQRISQHTYLAIAVRSVGWT